MSEQDKKTVDKLLDSDRMLIELAKANKKLALANAEKALAQNETADVNYKYMVLQLYMKYNLSAQDTIDELGNIVRGGANKSGDQ
jgi:hypothetical protein